MIAPAGHHCNGRSGRLNATFGGKDMGSMAQTGLLLVPSDALGHTWALPGVLGAGQGLPSETGMGNLKIPVWWRRAVLPSLPWVVCFLSFFLSFTLGTSVFFLSFTLGTF